MFKLCASQRHALDFGPRATAVSRSICVLGGDDPTSRQADGLSRHHPRWI